MVALADGGGTVARINSYGPFGEPGLNDQGRIRFTGQLYLPEAALYHFKARAYSAKWGRFLQTDPIDDADDPNLYAYVGNDPVNLTDPTGLYADKAFSSYGNSILQSARIQASPEYQKGQLKALRYGAEVGTLAFGVGEVIAAARIGYGTYRAFKVGEGASNIASAPKLAEHLRQLEKYGSEGFKELRNGSIRYYGKLSPANKSGEMAGRRVVREWNPNNGSKRTWHETLDNAGTTRIVCPQIGGTKVHYHFDASGKYLGKW